MMIVVLRDEDAENVLKALTDDSFGVTRIASTGGFFRRGNTTLIIGTDAERVDSALEVIRSHTTPPVDTTHRRATVFVLNVDRFERLD